jgi:GT2 family glycosyltransferase
VSSPPLFSCVTVAWNSADHLPACIDALRRSAGESGAAVEVIVVDNASGDGSPALAEAHGADRVVRNPVNAGFAVAASQGLGLATGDWVVMVNPDLVVDATFFAAALEAVATASEELAAFAPEIRFAADAERVNSRGITVDESGIPAEVGKGELRGAASPGAVFGATGGAALLRRSALDRVGGYEPLFFAYYEDVDLAWRLQRAGFRASHLPGAGASHAGSSTVGVGSPLQTYLVARNRRFLVRRHGPFDPRARAWRTVVEIGHAGFLTVATRNAAPLRGRAAALRRRRYLRFLRRVDRATLAGTAAALTPRARFGATLRRKLRSMDLEERH